jgi:hypothetical protein
MRQEIDSILQSSDGAGKLKDILGIYQNFCSLEFSHYERSFMYKTRDRSG